MELPATVATRPECCTRTPGRTHHDENTDARRHRLAGCAASTAPDAGGGAVADTINTELWYAPATFDPAKATATSDLYTARLGFDTLLRQGDSEPLIGGLATEWTANSASDYSFTIRKGATCADGTAITPSVVTTAAENRNRVVACA